MKRNVFSWIAALACTMWGIALFYFFSEVGEIFSGAHIHPFASRIVFFVGPLGWLLFFLIGALLTIRFRRSGLGSIIAVGFLSAAIAVACALLFTSISCPWSIILPRLANSKVSHERRDV